MVSRQSCLELCRDRVHSVLCRDSGARHCITTRPDAHTTGTRCHEKEGWARMTEAPCHDKLHKVVKKRK